MHYIKLLPFLIQKNFCIFFIYIVYYLYIITLFLCVKKIQNNLLENCLNYLEIRKNSFFSIFLSISFIVFLLYNNFFIEKLPRNLNEFSLLLVVFSVVIICIQLYNIYKYTNHLPNTHNSSIKYNKKFKHWLRVFKIKYIQKAYNALLTYFVMTPVIHDIYKILFLNIAVYKIQSTNTIYFIFYIVQKIIVISIFLFEIIYYNHINYFYKVFWLYSLPLLLQLFRYSGRIGALIRIDDLFFI